MGDLTCQGPTRADALPVCFGCKSHAILLIAEHIGTKTAVQIRSHAQKFFNKLEKKKEAGENVEQGEQQLVFPSVASAWYSGLAGNTARGAAAVDVRCFGHGRHKAFVPPVLQ